MHKPLPIVASTSPLYYTAHNCHWGTLQSPEELPFAHLRESKQYLRSEWLQGSIYTATWRNKTLESFWKKLESFDIDKSGALVTIHFIPRNFAKTFIAFLGSITRPNYQRWLGQFSVAHKPLDQEDDIKWRFIVPTGKWIARISQQVLRQTSIAG